MFGCGCCECIEVDAPFFENRVCDLDIVKELLAFRRALRGEDKIAFDNLMNQARQHASSCTITPMFDPMDAVFLSILVEQEKEISSLKEVLRGSILKLLKKE